MCTSPLLIRIATSSCYCLDCNLILDLTLTVTIPVGAGGSSFNDLSPTDFLDKFMEKKPKQNTWHSGSQIERSKKDCYLNGVLAFTRTIGDCELKTADSFHCFLFTSDLRPKIQYIILTKDVEFLILACDGIWDVFSS